MLAVVPVGAPDDAKRRLSPVLSAGERARLVKVMLEDVVAACGATDGVDRILVVSPARDVAPPVAEELVDPGEGHAAAIALALRQAGADGAVVVMADCPLVRPATLARLVTSAAPVAIAPAQDGGTNALALRPVDAVAPAFGVPDGARKVIERCRAAGFEPAIVDEPGLRFDVDTPADLDRVLELGAGTRTGAFLRTVLGRSATAP